MSTVPRMLAGAASARPPESGMLGVLWGRRGLPTRSLTSTTHKLPSLHFAFRVNDTLETGVNDRAASLWFAMAVLSFTPSYTGAATLLWGPAAASTCSSTP